MHYIGILGGMGPAATVDFMTRLLALTPATRDQEHLPVVVACLPQVPDRSAAILDHGPDPLPALLHGIRLLNQADVGVIAVPCNTSHHWYSQMSQASAAPILHIAEACVERVPPHARTLILATRGALHSGFYQRALDARGLTWELPARGDEQTAVNECIQLVKAGQAEAAGLPLTGVLQQAARRGIEVVILACTELPIALRHADTQGLKMIDSNEELARTVVNYALAKGWQSRQCA